MSSPEFPHFDAEAYNTAQLQTFPVEEVEQIIKRATAIIDKHVPLEDNRRPHITQGLGIASELCLIHILDPDNADDSQMSFGQLSSTVTTSMAQKNGSNLIPTAANSNTTHEAMLWSDEAISLIRSALFHALPPNTLNRE